MSTKEIIAIITARGGSKKLPKKNIKLLNGKPLIAYTIEASLQCTAISRTIVSTDDPEIKSICRQSKVEVVDRPSALAQDNSLSQDVVRHVFETLNVEPPNFVLLQPTSPLRTTSHLNECIASFFSSVSPCYNSAISVTTAEHNPYKMLTCSDGRLKPLFDVESLDVPRQLLPDIMRQNGAIYLCKTFCFLQKNTFFIPPVMPYVMPNNESIDIDTDLDFRLCELILKDKLQTSVV